MNNISGDYQNPISPIEIEKKERASYTRKEFSKSSNRNPTRASDRQGLFDIVNQQNKQEKVSGEYKTETASISFEERLAEEEAFSERIEDIYNQYKDSPIRAIQILVSLKQAMNAYEKEVDYSNLTPEQKDQLIAKHQENLNKIDEYIAKLSPNFGL